MKFVNNGEKAVKVKTEGNEKLPPVFRTVKLGEIIKAESVDYIKGYKKDGLVVVLEKPKDEPEETKTGIEGQKTVAEPIQEEKVKTEAPAQKAKQGHKKGKKKK